MESLKTHAEVLLAAGDSGAAIAYLDVPVPLLEDVLHVEPSVASTARSALTVPSDLSIRRTCWPSTAKDVGDLLLPRPNGIEWLWEQAVCATIKSWTRSGEVKVTSAVSGTGIPCADSKTICARRQVTIDPQLRRRIRGAAASYGLSYVYMGRQLAGRGLSPLVLSAAQLTAATGLLVLVTPLAGLQPVQLTPRSWRPSASSVPWEPAPPTS